MARRTVTSALTAALRGVKVQPVDAAVVELARRYATELDGDGDLGKLGPQLLACLTALGMTPAARAAVAKGGQREQQPAASPLDELRDRRRDRQRRTAAVDPAAG